MFLFFLLCFVKLKQKWTVERLNHTLLFSRIREAFREHREDTLDTCPLLLKAQLFDFLSFLS